jgi:hypothetical protein
LIELVKDRLNEVHDRLMASGGLGPVAKKRM